MLEWQVYRCLIRSLKDFLDTEISTDSVTGYDSVSIPVRIGRKEDNNWTLPCFSVYCDEGTLEQLEVGSNKKIEKHLIIIEIYAKDDGQRQDLAYWLVDKLKNGFRYYSYVHNVADVENPTKTAGGLVNVESYVSNTKVVLGLNTDEVDANRHRVSIRVWISGGC